MEFDDFLETEVGVAVAATAALFSPRVRKALRQGAVYGVAGALMAGDAIAGFAKGVGRGAQQVAASANGAVAGAEAAPATPSRRAAKAAGPQAPAAEGAARKGEATSSETKTSIHGTTTDGMSPGAAASTAASISSGQATTNPADETKSGRKGREKPTNE